MFVGHAAELCRSEECQDTVARLGNFGQVPPPERQARPTLRFLPASCVGQVCAGYKAHPYHGTCPRSLATTTFSRCGQNASIWTGGKQGFEVISGDILLDSGLVKGLGAVDVQLLEALGDFATFDARGAWVTPGCGSFRV